MSGGAFPTSPAPAQITLRSLQPTRVSRAHSLKRQARTRGAQCWGIKLAWSPLRRSEFMPLYAFLMAQRGQADPFTTILAAHTAPQGSWPGSPVVNGAGQTGRTVNLRGLTAGQTGIAKAGDFIKFANHGKVYMVTADANSDGGGLAALTIEPQLIATIAYGEALVTSSVPFTVALAADNMEANLQPGVFYGLEIDLIEVW